MESFEDLSRVNLNLLVSLQVLLAYRNVTQAAASLNLTQSTMSRNLSQLREMFGDPLLVRSGASLVRTPRADGLHRRLEGLLSEVREVIHEDGFDPRRDAQEFIIAAPA
jgi:DNA-binding transcriptional LysR family regulator